MTFPSSLVVVLLVAQTAVPHNQNPAPLRPRQAAATKRETPVVQVGLFSYRADGTVQGAAYDTRLTAANLQYVTECAIGGGDQPLPDAASDAWRVSGRILRVSPEEAVIELEWQRLRSAGVAVTSPVALQQLTLHSGDRVALDSATIGATGTCPARTVEFEAHFAPALYTWVPPPGVMEIGGASGPRVAPATPRGGGGRGGASGLAPDGTSLPKRAPHAPKDR